MYCAAPFFKNITINFTIDEIYWNSHLGVFEGLEGVDMKGTSRFGEIAIV